MVDAVADDMGERIDDHLDHFPVHLDIAALQAKVDALAQIPAKVAHHARDGGEQPVDALHPRLGNGVAHEIGRASCREKSVSVRVDLGGRRILKNKKTKNIYSMLHT